MATTMTPALANNIANFKKYVDDPSNSYAVFKAASLTADLETPMGEFLDSGEFSYPVFPLDNSEIPDYDAKNGYTSENVTYERRTVIFKNDKGYSIPVDYRDLKESHLTAVSIYNNKVRMRDVPSIDKFRLKALCQGRDTNGGTTVAITKKVTGAITKDNFFDKYDDAVSEIFNAEIPTSGLILYCPTETYNAIKNSAQVKRVIDLKDKNVDRNVEYIDSNTKLIVIPKDRWVSGAEFILVQPSCLICGTKYNSLNFFEKSERFDGCLINKRFVHDCMIQKDRAKGVYVACTTSADFE